MRLARRIYATRIERDQLFPETIFHQPAWSLMLDLFIAHHEQRVVNTSAACIGAQVPQSTALKWLERMERAGLIARSACAHDSRLMLVRLTPNAMARMDRLLSRLARQLESELRSGEEGYPEQREQAG